MRRNIFITELLEELTAFQEAESARTQISTVTACHMLYAEKVARMLGFARRANLLHSGTVGVSKILHKNRAHVLFLASDMASDSLKEAERLLAAYLAKEKRKTLIVCRAFSKAELSSKLDKSHRAFLALSDRNFGSSICGILSKYVEVLELVKMALQGVVPDDLSPGSLQAFMAIADKKRPVTAAETTVRSLAGDSELEQLNNERAAVFTILSERRKQRLASLQAEEVSGCIKQIQGLRVKQPRLMQPLERLTPFQTLEPLATGTKTTASKTTGTFAVGKKTAKETKRTLSSAQDCRPIAKSAKQRLAADKTGSAAKLKQTAAAKKERQSRTVKRVGRLKPNELRPVK